MISITARDIIEWADSEGYICSFYGDPNVEIKGFSSLSNYKNGTITWINLKNPVDNGVLMNIQCSVIQKGVSTHPKNYFVTEESKSFFFALLERFFSNSDKGIAERQNTYIGESVVLGENVKIGCNCVLDGEITIGDNTIIEHNVTMYNSITIGSDCIIHSGTVIGKDGFGYSFDKNNIPQKVQHFGGVQIGNHVEIGCNCAIDRGTIDDTIISDNTKIDSLVLVAHNVIIGRGCLIVGQTDIAGSCIIGDCSYVGIGASIENKTSIGNNSFVGMGTVVRNDIGDNMALLKNGIQPIRCKNYRRFL